MFSLDLPPLLPDQQAVCIQDVAERAESELRRNAYVALKNIACEYHEGVLVLSGCLPTYYLKQVAQETVAHLDGVERIENRIEVVSTSQRSTYRF